MRYHYLDQYIASTQHRITVSVIGAGGTGSHVLTNLATMNHALINLGRSPLMVTTYDPDYVASHNVGRQMFSPSDIDKNKAVVLTERINRFFGTDWDAEPVAFGKENSRHLASANILISCVDSAKTRRDIAGYIKSAVDSNSSNFHFGGCPYWMDIGNTMDSGQVILGTLRKVKQPKDLDGQEIESLPCWNEEFKNVRDKKDEPSCSLAESLGKQDLFINKTMANNAISMLWHLFRHYRIHYRGIYVNQRMMKTQAIML